MDMVEAGNEKFEATVEPDETSTALPDRRNHYQQSVPAYRRYH
jgi:hypothetical protein